MKGLCFKATLDTSGTYSGNFVIEEFFKVCGKITKFDKISSTTYGDTYYPLEIDNSYIGTVDDGVVYDEMACKSGFALYFYANKALKNPSTNYDNNMFKMCVFLVDIKGQKIKYKIGSRNENEFNLNHLSSVDTLDGNSNHVTNLSSISSVIGYYNDNLKIKAEIFQKYINVFTSDKQKKCAEDEENMNEPYICNDDQLRK